MTFKEKVDTAQSIVTIVAVFIGGLWTYNIFVKERKEYPHANIEQKISHVTISERANLLRTAIEISNTGTAQINIRECIIRVEQILPIPPCPKVGVCVANEVSDALQAVVRKNDNFTWPLIAERTSFAEVIEIEPGEKQVVEFEFAVPLDLKVARVYSYFRNEKLDSVGEIGWSMSNYYDFRTLKEVETK